ncbi:hypothetical protein NJB1507_40880 [Mycobacterium marinum]|uniref:hypothetical protein n=1 Tax=Mycobacterium marinum TaxID=1781 RepID=UPI0021C3114F|nr:hypothetical protein [Mycobacterium marinum]GJO31562.1 hypothetical protein NJB1507_40880 [Mycobacterium marinum]
MTAVLGAPGQLESLVGALGGIPLLAGALCRGHSDLWDELLPPNRDPDPAATALRLEFAVSACRRCPALAACAHWAASLPPGALAGVVAGQVREPHLNPLDLDRQDDVGAATVTARVMAFVDSRGRACAADLVEIGLTRSQACTYLNRLANSGRIRRIGRGQYSRLSAGIAAGVRS